MLIPEEVTRQLRLLEESLWRAETRFDTDYMQHLLADDFFEFGRSGRTYNRAETLSVPAQPIDVELPLPDLVVHMLAEDVALVTYRSAWTRDGLLEQARRSSIWSRTAVGWKLRFHQGTPI